MSVATGIVRSGQVVLDEPLSDGTPVYVVPRIHPPADPPSAEALAELEVGIAEAERGETISGEELFARLRRNV